MINLNQNQNSPAYPYPLFSSKSTKARPKDLFLLPTLIAGLGFILATSAPAQTFTTLHVFTASPTNSSGVPTNSDGSTPYGGVIVSDNTLYGTTHQGGASGSGTVFAVKTDGSGFTNLHTFTATSGTLGTNGDGAAPYWHALLILSGNTLYGTASAGGAWGNGTVFAVNTDGTGFTNLHNFAATPLGTNTDGSTPLAGLFKANNTLYGTTYQGGSSSNGTVFSLNTDGTGFTNLHSFARGRFYEQDFQTLYTNSDGAFPNAGVILSGNTLYGTAPGGGPSGNGTLFAVNTDGSGFTNLHTFTATPFPAPYPPDPTNSDGANPYPGLILSGNTLYGTANAGGVSGNGTVFALNTNGTGFTNLHNFTPVSGALDTNSDGSGPTGLILLGQTLYGTAGGGGASDAGTVFALNTDGTGFTTLHSFALANYDASYEVTNSDGASPICELALSGNILYGTASSGGTNGNGTVFSLALPPPLQLTVAPSGDDITVSWPTNYVGYILQRSVNLGVAGWNTYTLQFPPVISNGQFVVTLPITSSQQGYYRLRSP
jgi:uncharacterized repeat protein (TIGR03803 family)